MSPRFPGMDPFLEGSLWMSVHTRLCAVIAWQLAPLVRPEYLVLPTERFVLEDLDSISVTTSGSVIPDVGVARSGGPDRRSSDGRRRDGDGAAATDHADARTDFARDGRDPRCDQARR